MVIVFLSSYLSPHQLELSKKFYDHLNGDYYFIATEATPKMRISLGYPELNDLYDYVIKTYEGDKQMHRAKYLISNCDALIVGSAPDYLYTQRLIEKKLTFKYSERFFKTPFNISNLFVRIGSMFKHLLLFQNHNFFLLCASAYTAYDCKRFSCFRGRMYKWGYFPGLRVYKEIDALIDSKDNNSIVWAGRFIDWKHPETVIEIASRLKNAGYSFRIELIGEGELLESIKKQIRDKDLCENVVLTGALPNDKVRDRFEKAQILLFTSDRQEGWGAVLNEGMNGACAVVASIEAGSTLFLVEDGVNGLIYRCNDIDALYNKITLLLDNTELRKQISKKAYETIYKDWNAEVAACRLINIVDILMHNRKTYYYENAICSKAPIIKG